MARINHSGASHQEWEAGDEEGVAGGAASLTIATGSIAGAMGKSTDQRKPLGHDHGPISKPAFRYKSFPNTPIKARTKKSLATGCSEVRGSGSPQPKSKFYMTIQAASNLTGICHPQMVR
jgi:hypothetical protein